MQTYKGWAFIIMTSALLFFMLSNQLKQIVQEVETRQQAEDALRRNYMRLDVLLQVSSILRKGSTLQEMLPVLLDKTLEALDTTSGSIILFDAQSGEQSFTTARGFFCDLEEQQTRPVDGISGSVLSSGVAHVSKEFAQDLLVRPAIAGIVPSGWGGACLPVRASDKILGVLYAGVPLPRQISPDELNLLSSLAEIAGTAIHRTSLHEETSKGLQKLQSLRAIDLTINAGHELRDTLDVLLAHVLAQLGLDAAALFLVDKEADKLTYAAGRGFSTGEYVPPPVRLSDTPFGEAVLQQRAISTTECSSYEAWLLPLGTRGFAECFSVPLVSRNEVKGVLAVFSRKRLIVDAEWMHFLETLAGQAAIAVEKSKLFENLTVANEELIKAYDATIEGWAHALDLRDEETQDHSLRATEITLAMARKLGIAKQDLVHIRRGAILHDVGKMGIPDAILFKPGKLTDDEWNVMRKHPEFAYQMLSHVEYLRPALAIPYCHHEKWDGTGYPRGLSGADIPLEARIFAVVDVYDALTSNRPYRVAWSRAQAVNHIVELSGKHFDPDIVELFVGELEKSF